MTWQLWTIGYLLISIVTVLAWMIVATLVGDNRARKIEKKYRPTDLDTVVLPKVVVQIPPGRTDTMEIPIVRAGM